MNYSFLFYIYVMIELRLDNIPKGKWTCHISTNCIWICFHHWTILWENKPETSPKWKHFKKEFLLIILSSFFFLFSFSVFQCSMPFRRISFTAQGFRRQATRGTRTVRHLTNFTWSLLSSLAEQHMRIHLVQRNSK